MTRFFIVLTLALFTNTLFSQTLETIDWGKYKTLEKNTRYKKTLGYNNDYMFVLRCNTTDEKTYWIDQVSLMNYEVESSSEITLPNFLDNPTQYYDAFYKNDKLILFTIANDKTNHKKRLFVQYLNTNGTLKNKPLEMGTISSSNLPKDNFHITETADNKLMLFYHKTFSDYNQEPLTIKIINSNLQVERTENIILPDKYVGNVVKILQIEPTTKNRVVILASITAQKGKKYVTRLATIIYWSRLQKFVEVPVKLSKGLPARSMFTFNKEGNIIVAGFYAAKTSKIKDAFVGVYYRIIDPTQGKMIPSGEPKFYYYPIPKDMFLEMQEKYNGETSTQQFNFFPRSISLMDNGGFIFTAEQYFLTTREMVDPRSKKKTYIKYHHYNDIMLFGVDGSGKIKWLKKIDKDQYSINDDGWYSSIVVLPFHDKVKILYNDNPSNVRDDLLPDEVKQLKNNIRLAPKGMATIATVFYDGATLKSPMFPDNDEDAVIIPKIIYKKDGQYFTIAQYRRDFKFGIFETE